MLGKLDREIARARAPAPRVDAADHCTNAAWTAWPLVARVWADMKGNWKVKVAVTKAAGVPIGKLNRKTFEDFVQSESQCPELAYCKLITNASKHVGASRGIDDPVFMIAPSLGASFTHSSLSPGDLDWLPVYDEGDNAPWAFKIVKGEALDGKD